MNQKFDVKIEPEQHFSAIINSNNQVKPKIEPKTEEKKIQDKTICKICKKKLSTENYLRYHKKVFHSSDLDLQVYFCDHCDFKFLNKNCLIKHLKLNHQKRKEIKFECDFDGKIFVTKNKLLGHMTYHYIAVKKCKICEKEIKHLSQHMSFVHSSNNEKVQCKICNKIVKNQQCLKIHLKTHNKKHQCQICGRKFARVEHLKEHLKVHEDRFAFRCEKCQKNFNSLSNLRAHLKIHDTNRLKPFKCQHCDYSTDKKDHLTTHLKTHDKNREKNFNCSKCDYKTDRKSSLKIHLQIHEQNRRKFPCLYCNYEATARGSLTAHLKSKHDSNKI